MIVESIRLLFTLATTAIGFQIGRAWPGWFPGRGTDGDMAVISGAVIGAGIGYVVGGVLGRYVRKALDAAPNALARATGPQLLAGTFGMVAGLIAGGVIATPLVVLLPSVAGWPIGALVVLVLTAFGASVFVARAHDVWPPAGPGHGKPVGRSETREGDGASSQYLVDSSAAIDGRVLELARSGLLMGSVWAPAFVVDELQAIADSGDKPRRRRGRRGLDVLDAMRDVPGIDLVVLEESVPDQMEVDAKLISLAARTGAALVTTDHNLARAASLRGVSIVNPHVLGESLRPVIASGDAIRVKIEKAGSEPGQGVGYLEDGTMVVVSGGAGRIGDTVDAEVSNLLRTSVGRMAFARMSH